MHNLLSDSVVKKACILFALEIHDQVGSTLKFFDT